MFVRSHQDDDVDLDRKKTEAKKNTKGGGPTGDDDEGPRRHEDGDTGKKAAPSRQEAEVASEQGKDSLRRA